MDRENLRITTKQKIDEVNNKLSELKKELAGKNEDEMTEVAKSSLTELNQLRDEIQVLYEKLAKTSLTDELEFDKVEKNIYNSIESFNNAFTKAGSMLRTK